MRVFCSVRLLSPGRQKLSTMRQMAVQGHAPFLPEEILMNILKRLPVKSLIRFRCVCKHWKNLLKTPSFVADHLGYSSVQNPSLLLKHNNRCEPLHISLIDREMHVREVQNPALIDSLPEVRIIGSCNGVLCVAIDEVDISDSSLLLCNSLLLWNPAIREVKQIPRTKTVSFNDWDCTVGFGFSALANDYKIVKTYAEGGDVVSEVQIYSLSTNSWKEIEFGGLEGISLFGDPVTANGYSFWYGDKQSLEEECEDVIDVIVAFDIAKEAFSLIAQPPLSDDSLSQFTVFEDKFAVLCLTKIGEFPNCLHSLIDLWVLEEDKGSSTQRWSWTKKWSSNPCPPMLHLRTIWRNEIVCIDIEMLEVAYESGHEMKNEEQNVCLNLINICTNELKVPSIPKCGHLPNVFNHVESLVPVNNIHYEEA